MSELIGLNEDAASDVHVRLKWVTPNADEEIGHIARVSNSSAKIGDPADKLIGYLLRKQHWSPFQMANMCLEVHTTRDISAQILRHASFAFQEFSTRYADVEELKIYKECRFQDNKNRQNSWTYEQMISRLDLDTSHGMSAANEMADTVEWWNKSVVLMANGSMDLYREARERGIAKETARTILPFGLCPTVMYINGTFRSWIHYIALRSDPATQKEHRIIAEGGHSVMLDVAPNTSKAYEKWNHINKLKNDMFEAYNTVPGFAEMVDVELFAISEKNNGR